MVFTGALNINSNHQIPETMLLATVAWDEQRIGLEVVNLEAGYQGSKKFDSFFCA